MRSSRGLWTLIFTFVLLLTTAVSAAEPHCSPRAGDPTQIQEAGLAACVNMCQQVSQRQEKEMTRYFGDRCQEELERQSRSGIRGAANNGREIFEDAILRCLPLAAKNAVMGPIHLAMALPQMMSQLGERLTEAAAKNQLPEGFSFRECDESADCKRALARQLINYQGRSPQGEWLVSDQTVDHQTRGMRVTDMLAMIPEHRRKSRDECSRDLASIRRRVNGGGDDWTLEKHREVYDTLGTQQPHCLGILKLSPPELDPQIQQPSTPKPSTPVPAGAKSIIDELSFADTIGVGRTCVGRDFGVELCGEIASVIVPIPGIKGASLAFKAAKAGIAGRLARSFDAVAARTITAANQESRALRMDRELERRTGVTPAAREARETAPAARDTAPSSEPRPPASVPTASRTQFISRHEMVDVTTEAQNRKWMELAKQTKPDGRTLFVDIENSKMKFLNDSLRDKSLVTAMTNRHKQIVMEKMEKLGKDFPNVEILPYSDFKALRFAIREPIPPALRGRLNDLFREANKEFRDELVKNKLVRAEDLSENWFRAGVGRTADQANLASRYARQAPGENIVRDYADSALHGNLGQTLQNVEQMRDQVQSGLGPGSNLLEALPGSNNRMIPRLDVMDVVRKEKTPEAIRTALNQRYGGNVTTEQATHLRDYLGSVDEFSPGIHVARREVPTLSDATAGGLSADFAGMGSHNMRETARALARSRTLDEALIATREGERTVTSLFQKRMRDRQAIIRNYLEDKRGMKGLQITCSGDDCVAAVPKALNSRQRDDLVQRLSRTDEPAGMRLAFIRENVTNATERNVLAAHGEGIEKALRKELAGKVPEDTLRNVLFAVEMNGSTTGQGSVRLITGNSRVKLGVAERARIQEAFSRAVNGFNEAAAKSGGTPARYIVQP